AFRRHRAANQRSKIQRRKFNAANSTMTTPYVSGNVRPEGRWLVAEASMGGRAWMAGVLGLVTVVLYAGPAGAQTEAIFSEACPQVFGHTPAGNLDRKTDPAPRSTVMPGTVVVVELRWPNQVLAG